MAGQSLDLRPRLHESVVREGVRSAAFAFADHVEAVGEVTSGLGLAGKLRCEIRRRLLAAPLEQADEVLGHLPTR